MISKWLTCVPVVHHVQGGMELGWPNLSILPNVTNVLQLLPTIIL